MRPWSRPILVSIALLLVTPTNAQVRIDDPDDPFARRGPQRRAVRPPAKAPSGWLGVELVPELAPPRGDGSTHKKPPMPKPTGRVMLKTVFAGSGAAAAGLVAGDIVLEINRTRITGVRQLIGLVRRFPVGAKLVVVFERSGKRDSKTVVLGRRPDRQQMVKDAWLGKTLPATFAFTDPMTGTKHSLKQFRGKPLIIEYWATYCGPCKRAAPWLSALMTQHAAQGLKVIKVSTEAQETVRNHLRRKRPTPGPQPLALLDSDDVIKRELRLSAMPTFLYIDSRGVVVAIGFGARSKSELDNNVQLALKKTPTN